MNRVQILRLKNKKNFPLQVQTFLGVKDVCRHLHLSRNTVETAARSGALTGYKFGGAWRFTWENVLAWGKKNHHHPISSAK